MSDFAQDLLLRPRFLVHFSSYTSFTKIFRMYFHCQHFFGLPFSFLSFPF